MDETALPASPSFLKSTLYAFGLVLAVSLVLGGLYSVSPPDAETPSGRLTAAAPIAQR